MQVDKYMTHVVAMEVMYFVESFISIGASI